MPPETRQPQRWAKRLLFAALWLTTPTLAEEPPEPRWYQVNLLVFRHLYPDATETWPRTALEIPQDWTRLVPPEAVASTPRRRGAVATPQIAPRMLEAHRQLRNSRDFRPLAVLAWREALEENQSGSAVLIEVAGEPGIDLPIHGWVRLRLNRYLHIQTQLWTLRRASDASPAMPALTWNAPQLPTLAPAFPTPDNPVDFVLRGYRALPFQPPRDAPLKIAHLLGADPVVEIASMSQSRRMRSGELHYLDHPRFGLLVLVEPVDPEYTAPAPAAGTLPLWLRAPTHPITTTAPPLPVQNAPTAGEPPASPGPTPLQSRPW
ncbi:MAG: CsiV family protein [Pseudomonadota bacterium]|nr:CsiV family protein [Pseudomonadota bacterium]